MAAFQLHVRRDLERVSARPEKRTLLVGCIFIVAGVACAMVLAGGGNSLFATTSHESVLKELDALSMKSGVRHGIRKEEVETAISTSTSIKDLKHQLHREVKNLQKKGSIQALSAKLEWPNSVSQSKGSNRDQSLATSSATTVVQNGAQSSVRGSTLAAVSGPQTAEEKIAYLEAELKKAKVALTKHTRPIPKQLLNDADTDGNITVAEGDDDDEDRTKEGFLKQVLRLPLVYHLFRTVGHYMPDLNTSLSNESIVATNESHAVRLFDDDRLVNIEPVEASPISPQDRGPEYYPGGEFVDRFRLPGQQPQKFMEGGFQDLDVEVSNVSNVINITATKSYMVAEDNFKDVADDNNVEVLAPQPRHPRKHIGPEYNAGGAMADTLRAPDFYPNPLGRDDYVYILPEVPVAARPVRTPDTDLDFVDQDVPADTASLPADDGLLKALGLPSRLDYPGRPVQEEDYKYGMMAGFPDRDVNQGPVADGAAAIGQGFSDVVAARDVASREAGEEAETVPYEEDDEVAVDPGAAAPAA